MNTKLQKLSEIIVANYVVTPLRTQVLNGVAEINSFFQSYGIVFPKKYIHRPKHEDGFQGHGFNQEGVDALVEFSKIIFESEPKFSFGTTSNAFITQIANIIIEIITKEDFNNEAANVVNLVCEQILLWFDKLCQTKTVYIPCRIVPRMAQSFFIGPIEFKYFEDFKISSQYASQNLIDKMQIENLFEFMEQQSGYWVGEFKISNADKQRGLEKADLAIDIGLVAMQLTIPLNYSREMSRITGRCMPANIPTYYKDGDSIVGGRTNRDPAFTLDGSVINYCSQQATIIYSSVGLRVNEFISGISELPQLSQSWCDAAYWFHEGVAEQVDTIAIAKLETGLEVLLKAVSSRGSEQRLILAIATFYGLTENDLITPSSNQTVKSFVKSIVSSRSRILHGTKPTITLDSIGNENKNQRIIVENLARTLLSSFTVFLDEYCKCTDSVDDLDAFLTWVKLQMHTMGSVSLSKWQLVQHVANDLRMQLRCM